MRSATVISSPRAQLLHRVAHIGQQDQLGRLDRRPRPRRGAIARWRIPSSRKPPPASAPRVVRPRGHLQIGVERAAWRRRSRSRPASRRRASTAGCGRSGCRDGAPRATVPARVSANFSTRCAGTNTSSTTMSLLPVPAEAADEPVVDDLAIPDRQQEEGALRRPIAAAGSSRRACPRPRCRTRWRTTSCPLRR